MGAVLPRGTAQRRQRVGLLESPQAWNLWFLGADRGSWIQRPSMALQRPLAKEPLGQGPGVSVLIVLGQGRGSGVYTGTPSCGRGPQKETRQAPGTILRPPCHPQSMHHRGAGSPRPPCKRRTPWAGAPDLPFHEGLLQEEHGLRRGWRYTRSLPAVLQH